MKLSKNIARKVLEIVDAPGGLTAGMGEPVAGKLCVEAAICLALGLPHGDNPPCVGSAVRAFKIKLNDCSWSSNQARAKGMRELAIAQLGSDEIDQMEFGKLMFLKGTQRLLPFVFRTIAESKDGEYKSGLLKHADLCEAVTTLDKAKKACKAASASAYAYAYASASASASACAYAYAYAYADASADASADFAPLKKHDKLLLLTAKIGVECLKELKSPGCRWLDLCKEAA